MVVNAAEFTAEQRANWDAASAGAGRFEAELESGLDVVSGRLLAGVRAGQSVLDLATGYGEPAVRAARVVGASGRVVGVDLSPGMLALARERAARAGVRNVTFAVGDFAALEQPDAAFDVVVSRFGLMLAVDHVAVFREIARVLKPGGALAAAVWAGPESNAFAAGVAAVVRLLGLASGAPGTPGTFAMSDRAALRADLATAGLVDVAVEEQVAPFRVGGVERYVELTRSLLAPGLRALATERFGSERPVRDAIAAAAAPYVVADGAVDLPSLAYCLRATRPR